MRPAPTSVFRNPAVQPNPLSPMNTTSFILFGSMLLAITAGVNAYVLAAAAAEANSFVPSWVAATSQAALSHLTRLIATLLWVSCVAAVILLAGIIAAATVVQEMDKAEDRRLAQRRPTRTVILKKPTNNAVYEAVPHQCAAHQIAQAALIPSPHVALISAHKNWNQRDHFAAHSPSRHETASYYGRPGGLFAFAAQHANTSPPTSFVESPTPAVFHSYARNYDSDTTSSPTRSSSYLSSQASVSSVPPTERNSLAAFVSTCPDYSRPASLVSTPSQSVAARDLPRVFYQVC